MMPTGLAPSLKIVSVNPLDHASEIKELFLADDHPEFPEYFDRAYPSAVQSGGKSWIGIDADGSLVLHIARFARRFTIGERVVTGGVLLNLMAAKTHRTVFPAQRLTRRLTTDSKSDRDVDFLYATASPAGSAILKAAGFSTVGTLQRFAFPLASGSWYSDAAARVYHAIVGIRAWNTSAEVVEHEARCFDGRAFEQQPGASSALRPVRPPELYRQCLAGYPTPMDYWFTFHRRARSTQPSAAAFIRGSPDRTATLYSVSRPPSLPLHAIVPALAAALRRAGYRRLSVSTVSGTHFARELMWAGFIPRPDRLPVLAVAVTELGVEAVRSITTWEITALDCDPYSP